MTSSRKAALEGYVLEATANDFESVASMTPDIKRWASSENVDVSDSLVVEAIERLLQSGKLKAYQFSKTASRYEPTTYSRSDIGDLWFRSG